MLDGKRVLDADGHIIEPGGLFTPWTGDRLPLDLPLTTPMTPCGNFDLLQDQFDHGFDYRLLDFKGSDAESFSGFARSFDVFGDGSVHAVYTPGHTLGHMSIVLRTGSGEVLIAGDAI